MIPGESERHFQKEIIHFCRTIHLPVYFTQRSIGSPSGWPDLVILRPPWVHIRELKTDTGKLGDAQVFTIDTLKKCDRVDVDVWRPQDWQRIVKELTT